MSIYRGEALHSIFFLLEIQYNVNEALAVIKSSLYVC
jgi:hypothetical protein